MCIQSLWPSYSLVRLAHCVGILCILWGRLPIRGILDINSRASSRLGWAAVAIVRYSGRHYGRTMHWNTKYVLPKFFCLHLSEHSNQVLSVYLSLADNLTEASTQPHVRDLTMRSLYDVSSANHNDRCTSPASIVATASMVCINRSTPFPFLRSFLRLLTVLEKSGSKFMHCCLRCVACHTPDNSTTDCPPLAILCARLPPRCQTPAHSGRRRPYLHPMVSNMRALASPHHKAWQSPTRPS